MRRSREDAQRTREMILAAAGQTIVQLGVDGFTIDAVAQEAGVTKGGVLHHFPSKDALVDSLIDQVLAQFEMRLAAELAQEPVGAPGRWLRAYIGAIFPARDEEMNLLPALAAAVAANAATIERIRAGMLASQQSAVADGIDSVTATIIRLAVDGAIFTRAFHLDVLDAQERGMVRARLIGMTVAH